jgi:DNA-directed RNA polymerase specialized sigma24 family protein
LQESVRQKNERASDEPQLQFHQSDESFTEETVIADRRVATPEDTAASDEMIELVQSALKGAPRADREAFILHAIEGFTVEEVAAITEHHADQVRSSIQTVRDQLRRSPPLAERYRDRLLANPGAD